MRKKSFLVAIPAGLLVLGIVLAGCDHGPAPVSVPPVTEGIAYAGEYGSIGAASTQLQYAQDGVVRKRENKDVEWGTIYPILQSAKLSVPVKFQDTDAGPLGEMAFILNGNSPAGIVVQVYDTEMGKLSGSVGVWIGIGQGTASLVTGMMPLKFFMPPAGTSGVDTIASTQADTNVETFYGKK
jgi:hypothetical protein